MTLFFVLTVILAGCSNHQQSSREEARYVMEHQEDFRAEILLQRIDSGTALGIFLGPDEPRWGDVIKNNSFFFSYIAVYETKEGKKKILLLKDTRPPKVVFEKILEVGTEVPTDTLTTK